MWGSLGVQQGLSDFTVLLQESIILFTLLSHAAVVIVFCPQPPFSLDAFFGIKVSAPLLILLKILPNN